MVFACTLERTRVKHVIGAKMLILLINPSEDVQ
jgi:hypothetical protein